MNKLTLGVLFLLGFCNLSVYSQDITETKDFELIVPASHIQNSLYHSIDFIDARSDKTNLGLVQLGAFNHQAQVVPQSPFPGQLQKVMLAVTDSTAKNGALLFHLRQLKFAEATAMTSEKGYCYLKAGLYSKNDNHYQKLAAIDTLLEIKSLDVTKAILKGGSKLITDFIASNLLKEASDARIYTHQELAKMDSTEKRELIVYNTDKYTEGLYYNYKSFSNQKPDKNIFVETKKDGRIASVKISGEDNNLVKVKPKEVYAIVYNGKPYIATQYGYYPVEKSKDDFYFTGKVKVAASPADIMVAQMMFGVVGVALAASANAVYEIRIDHTDGSFIKIREVGYE